MKPRLQKKIAATQTKKRREKPILARDPKTGLAVTIGVGPKITSEDVRRLQNGPSIHWRDFKNDSPSGSLKRRGVQLLTWRHNGNRKEASHGFGLLQWMTGYQRRTGHWEWTGGYSVKPHNVPTYWAEIPVPTPRPTIEDLLAKVTPQNRHPLLSWGEESEQIER
jgi:hypothetical protein